MEPVPADFRPQPAVIDIDRTQLIFLVVLLVAVPLQYLLTANSSESNRQYYLSSTVSGISSLKSFISVNSWARWCKRVLRGLMGQNNTDVVDPEMRKAEEKADDGTFASSDKPRHPRPPHVKYSVGQVLKHRFKGYRGVIIGWDEVAKVPPDWFDLIDKKKRDKHISQPNYAVLVDTRDRRNPQLAYIPESEIDITKNTKIVHPLVEHYFESFDGNAYVRRPWLQKVYPHG